MKAFVIMPYGGDNPKLFQEYKRVYRFLIQEAILAYDNTAEIIRQDHSAEGGYIIRNVIDNLANADLVVADLSYNNWNVAYELGLRHVMSKYGTVLICNDKTELPYDIKQMNVIIYPTKEWLDSMDDIAESITKAIGKAMKKNRSDSPVFDTYYDLPDYPLAELLGRGDRERAQLTALKEELSAAHAEIQQLRTKLEKTESNAGEDKQSTDVLVAMQRALVNRKYINEEAVMHLRELAENKDYDEFVQFLATVLRDGYLTEYDCKRIYATCRKLNIPAITKAYLETVVEFYPDSEELKAWLANAYAMDYREREKALAVVNKTVGIRCVDGQYDLVPKVRTRRQLGAMFDVYLHLKKYEDILLVGKLLLEKGNGKNNGIIYRNISAAAVYLEDYETAREASEKAVEAEPTTAMSYYIRFKYFDAVEDHLAAYEALEDCIRLDPEDADYYFLAAGEICDELCGRDPETLELCHIQPGERERFAAPFVLRALFNDPRGNAQRTLDFCKRNNFTDTVERLSALLSGKMAKDEFMEFYDFGAVEYCFRKQ